MALLGVVGVAVGCSDSREVDADPAPFSDGAVEVIDPYAAAPANTTSDAGEVDADHARFSNGTVEVIDPSGAAPANTTIAPADPSGDADTPAALVAFALGPAGPLPRPVRLRVKLPTARPPGDTLVLWTFDEAERSWHSQTTGRVLEDGRSFVVEIDYFSTKRVSLLSDGERAMLAGAGTGTVQPAAGCMPTVVAGRAVPAHASIPSAAEDVTVGGGKARLTREEAHRKLVRLNDEVGSKLAPLHSVVGEGVVFKNVDPEPHDGKPVYVYGAAPLAAPLASLGRMVREQSCGALSLMVIEAFDSTGAHPEGSPHHEGRAVDLTLLAPSDPSKPRASSPRFTVGLGRLAALAAEAGFHWTSYESWFHVHASMRSRDTVEPCSERFMYTPAGSTQPETAYFARHVVKGRTAESLAGAVSYGSGTNPNLAGVARAMAPDFYIGDELLLARCSQVTDVVFSVPAEATTPPVIEPCSEAITYTPAGSAATKTAYFARHTVAGRSASSLAGAVSYEGGSPYAVLPDSGIRRRLAEELYIGEGFLLARCSPGSTVLFSVPPEQPAPAVVEPCSEAITFAVRGPPGPVTLFFARHRVAGWPAEALTGALAYEEVSPSVGLPAGLTHRLRADLSIGDGFLLSRCTAGKSVVFQVPR